MSEYIDKETAAAAAAATAKTGPAKHEHPAVRAARRFTITDHGRWDLEHPHVALTPNGSALAATDGKRLIWIDSIHGGSIWGLSDEERAASFPPAVDLIVAARARPALIETTLEKFASSLERAAPLTEVDEECRECFGTGKVDCECPTCADNHEATCEACTNGFTGQRVQERRPKRVNLRVSEGTPGFVAAAADRPNPPAGCALLDSGFVEAARLAFLDMGAAPGSAIVVRAGRPGGGREDAGDPVAFEWAAPDGSLRAIALVMPISADRT